MDGIAAVEARIQQIMNQFGGGQATGGVLGASDPNATDPTATDASAATDGSGTFADALANAQSTTGTGTMPASTGSLNRAGVDPVQWAKDFLTKVGMPITSENVRAITAWEQAEGTKAHYNPLATTQAGYSGETRFNSVGVKNYTTYQDGIDANAQALMNGRYTNNLAALQAGNNAMAVAQAIANSPWGTHGGVIRVLQSQSQS